MHHVHNVVAFMEPADVFAPAVFQDVVDEQLFRDKVAPSPHAWKEVLTLTPGVVQNR